MLHEANDRQNRMKHAKMARRLKRGVLPPGVVNTGEPHTSKINPACLWHRRFVARLKHAVAI